MCSGKDIMNLQEKVQKLFPKIGERLGQANLVAFKCLKVRELHAVNRSPVGAYIRSLITTKRYQNTTIRELFLQQGITDIDKMSYIILKQYHQHLQENRDT